jgi:ubiquitin-protein ligase E3 B
VLSFDFPTKPVHAPKSKPAMLLKTAFGGGRGSGSHDEKAATLTALSTLQSCNLFISLIRTVLPSKASILNSLSWTPSLIPRLWRLMTIVGPKSPSQNGAKIFLSAARNPEKEHLMPIMQIFCEACGILFLTLDEDDIYTRQHPFTLDELSDLAIFLNTFCFTVYWTASWALPPADGSTTDVPEISKSVLDASVHLLGMLYDRSCRRVFDKEDEHWIVRELRRSSFIDDIQRGDARSLAVLTNMPHCVPFDTRGT